MTGRLIAFGHRSRVGKDTAARALGPQWERMAFADRIRRVLEDLDPVIHYGPLGATRLGHLLIRSGWETVKQDHHEVRRLLQELGMAGRMHLYPDVWSNVTVTEAAERVAAGSNVVITDLRFADEARLIREFGGSLYRIDRPGVPRLDHRTESALDDWDGWDGVIANDGSEEDFVDTVRALVGDGP